MEFSRQEYWSWLPLPFPEDLPNPGLKPGSLVSPALAADSLPLGHLGSHLFIYSRTYTFQSSCLQAGNKPNRQVHRLHLEAWRAAVHGVTKSQTQLGEQN